MRASLTALFNGWLDPNDAPPQQLIRHRFLVVAASFLGVLLAGRALEDLLRGDWTRGATVLVIALISPLLLWILKRTGRPGPAGVSLLLAGATLIVLLTAQGSHLFATTPLYVSLLPLSAGLVLGRRAALIWGAVGLALLGVMLLLHGLELRSNPEGWSSTVTRAFDLGIVVVMVTGLAVTFDGAQRAVFTLMLRRTDELAQENQVRRAAEDAARAAMESRTRFLASMSHELRTPLHGVIGSTRLLDGSLLPEDQRQLLMTARTSADQLLGLIDDVLDYARLDAAAVQLEQIPFDLLGLLEEVADPLRVRGRGQGVAVLVKMDGQLSRWRLGDPIRVRQIVQNLAGNAFKFTSEGRIVLSAFSVGSGVRIMVADTGIGMERDVLDSLFAPFVQAEGSTTRKFGGTGLGLAIVRRLVDVHNGAIEVDSEPSIGTKFSVTLPLPPAAAPDPQSIELSPVGSMRVLVVDDNAVNRTLASHMLRSGGHEVVAVAGGQQALERLESETYDVVLMDCQMPEIDGLETTRRLRGRGDNIVVVGLSASAQPEDRARALAAGMNAYLTKPIAPKTLLRALSRQASQAA